MSKAKLAAAREYIEAQQYGMAREILKTIPDDPTAKRWMAKLPRQRGMRRLGGCLIWLVFLFAGMLIGLLMGGGGTPREMVAAVPTAVDTATPGPSPTITNTPTPTLTLTPTLTETPTVTPSATLTPEPTATVAPLVFSGQGGTVLGPVTIPAGIYRATFTTGGYGIVAFTVNEGACGAGRFMTPGLFNESAGDATNGAEAVLTSESCRTLIEISNVQQPWALVFELVE